jgi:hypothetical protein
MSGALVLPPVPRVEPELFLGGRAVDLATRALVIAVVPSPRWGREAEVLAGVRQAAAAGADVVEAPGEPRLLGPAAAAGVVPVAARVSTPEGARAAWAAGARLLLVPDEQVDQVADAQPPDGWQLAPLVDTARAGRAAVAVAPGRPVALDVTRLAAVDAVAEASLALAVGVRLVRTAELRPARRVVEVMARLLEARR